MTANVGNTDRIIRIILGVLAAVIAFVVGPTSVGGIVLLVVAAILILTAFVSFCPLYRVLGITTRKAQA